MTEQPVPLPDVLAAAVQRPRTELHNSHPAAERLFGFDNERMEPKLLQKERRGQARCAPSDDDPPIGPCHALRTPQRPKPTVTRAVPATESRCDMTMSNVGG